MFSAMIEFNTIPEIGFAHHFYTDNYSFDYEKPQKSFEIVYVKSGAINAELYGQKMYIPEKSIFVLFRHLPIFLRPVNNQPQAHCTVQVEFDYNFTLLENDNFCKKEGALVLPFIVAPCKETEEIKRDLFSIVSDLGVSREENRFSAALKFLDILRRLDKMSYPIKTHDSIITHKTKSFIAKNIHRVISLSEIAEDLKLSSGHIDHVFKAEAGMPIRQYINNEKAKRISDLIHNRELSFKTACANVGIHDTSYGYRLFKKHIGLTPGEFLSGNVHKKD